MRYLVLLSLVLLSACAARDARGPISPQHLQRDYPLFAAAVVTDADKQQLQQRIAAHAGLTLKVFFGTWCGDSQREVPRLLGLLQGLDSNALATEWIALDRSKVDDERQTETFAVSRIPSIIVLQHGKEIGRITDTPTTSVADDLQAILAKAD
jgi:thiol-disulfide isomerase/thioredoxin